MNRIFKVLKNVNINDYIFSFIGTSIFYTGNLLFYNHKFNPLFFILYYLLILIILLAIKNIYLCIRKHKINEKKHFTKKQITLMMIPLIIVYLICYLGYFPGTFSYDIGAVNNMVVQNIVLSNTNPIIYTFLWGFCYKLELLTNITNFRIIIYTIIQLTFIMFTNYYLLKWLIKNNYNRTIIILVYLYLLLNPVLHITSIITSKDIIFSYLYLLLMIYFINIYKSYNKKNIFILFILGLLCLLFTNNFIIPMIIMCIIMFFYKRKISLIFLYSILCYSFILILFPLFNIRYTQPHEVLSIPIVQMSYVYNYTNTYTPKEKQAIKEVIPNIENYNPRVVDPMKKGFVYYKEDNLNVFWKMYYKGLHNNKRNYLKSFLNLNIRLWYPQLNNYDSYSPSRFIEEDLYLKKEYKNYVYKFYHKLSSTTIISKIPLLNIFFSFSFPFYFLLISLYLYKTKNYDKKFLFINIFILVHLLLYLFGPITIFRYLFYFYVCFPLLLVGLLTDKERKYEDK